MRFDTDVLTPLDPTPTHVVKMSCGGVRFIHNQSVDVDTRFKLCMHLSSCNKTVHLLSRVISSGREKNESMPSSEKYYVQVEFLDVDKNNHRLLANHIDYVIQKTGMSPGTSYGSAHRTA